MTETGVLIAPVLSKERGGTMLELIRKAAKKFPPHQFGRCFQATRWLIEKLPELKEKIFYVDIGKAYPLSHAVAITADGKIVDTQMEQFLLFFDIPRDVLNKYIYTQEEFDKFIPYKRQEQAHWAGEYKSAWKEGIE